MRWWRIGAGVMAMAAAAAEAGSDLQTWREQVFAAERAFAGFVAADALFFTDTRKVLRGRDEVVAGWRPFFDKPDAPFSWEPDQVEVLAGGQLALSTGPVRDPSGKVVARFNSIWRQESPGVWKVVFDKGEPLPK